MVQTEVIRYAEEGEGELYDDLNGGVCLPYRDVSCLTSINVVRLKCSQYWRWYLQGSSLKEAIVEVFHSHLNFPPPVVPTNLSALKMHSISCAGRLTTGSALPYRPSVTWPLIALPNYALHLQILTKKIKFRESNYGNINTPSAAKK